MKMKQRVLIVSVVVAVVMLPAMAGAVGGLPGPLFGLNTAPNGDLLVADAGAGIHAIDDGIVESTIPLPGVTDVSAIGRNSMWATTTGEDPETGSGQALHRVSNGQTRQVANLWEFEEVVNPDQGLGPSHEAPDSNPFDVQSLGGDAALVVDAGGNDLLRIDNQGDIELLAVFPDVLASTANLADLVEEFGCPFGPPEACALPPELPAQAVPTSVAVGPDGYYYVGELVGFPAPTGLSGIWRVSPDATGAVCPNPDCVRIFDGGFTSIIDLAFGPDGNLYVAEMDERSWAAVEIFLDGSGGTINSCDVSTMSCVEVATEIPLLTAISFGKDGSLWATRNALIPNGAEVFEVS